MATTITQAVVSSVASPSIVNADTGDTTAIKAALATLYSSLGVTPPDGFDNNGFTFAENPDGTSVAFVKWKAE